MISIHKALSSVLSIEEEEEEEKMLTMGSSFFANW